MLSSISRRTDDGERLRAQPLLAGSPLPLLVSPVEPGLDLLEHQAAIAAFARRELPQSGALLFRGFDCRGIDEFKRFAAGFGEPLLGYDFGSTPRSKLADGVFSSTEYPAHQSIPLHNEQSYCLTWPMKVWFYSMVAAEHGGETPIADSRQIYGAVDVRIRRRFEAKGLMYVRNFGNGLDVPWTQVFATEDRGKAQAYCRANGIECVWKDDGELRTRQVCQATARHPTTGDWVWFNQAHLFHISGLPLEVRESLREVVSDEDLPRNVYYGDGAALEDSVLEEIRGVLAERKVEFAWRDGDVLMLDNMLTAHARNPFRGRRRVVVAMAEAHSAPVLPQEIAQ
jgi:alpha-ketoglutarate-dependent taurine dioxygenase